jgi:hypothetical protein
MLDPTQHNYLKKLIKLFDQAKLPKAGLVVLDVYHDDWCAIYRGRYCNCDPDIRLRRYPPLDPERN